MTEFLAFRSCLVFAVRVPSCRISLRCSNPVHTCNVQGLPLSTHKFRSKHMKRRCRRVLKKLVCRATCLLLCSTNNVSSTRPCIVMVLITKFVRKHRALTTNASPDTEIWREVLRNGVSTARLVAQQGRACSSSQDPSR